MRCCVGDGGACVVGIYPEGPRRVDDGLGCRVAKERCRNAEMALQLRSPCMVCEEFFLEGGAAKEALFVAEINRIGSGGGEQGGLGVRRAAGSGVLDPPERHVVGYCGKFLRCFWCSTADITPLTIGLFSPSNHHAPSLRPPFPLFRRLCSAILPRGPGLG